MSGQRGSHEMTTDRRTLLLRRANMKPVIHNQGLPPELCELAKSLFDKVDTLLGLQDAQARKEQRDKQTAVPPPL